MMMVSKSRVSVVVLVLGVVLVCVPATRASTVDDNSFETCLRKDSISCVQIHVYRKLRAMFGQENINLIAGFQLSKNHQQDEQGRLLAEEEYIDNDIFGDHSVAERQTALEDFIYAKMTNFFKERSFQWSFNPAMEQLTSTARMALDSIPQDIKDKTSNYIAEARGRKKILKSIIPIVVAAKVKIVAFFTLMYVVVAVVAKKALIASLIALAITLFISLKKIWAKHYHHYPHHDYHGDPHHGSLHHPVSSGWASGGWSGWDSYDLHGGHSSPGSHHLPYSAHKPSHR